MRVTGAVSCSRGHPPADLETEFYQVLFHTSDHCTRKGRASPPTPRLTGDDELAPKTRPRRAQRHCAERPAIPFPPSTPFPDTGQANNMPTDLRQPGQLPSLRTPESLTYRMRVTISGSRAPWALRLPITRDLPLSVSLHHSARPAVPREPVRPHNAQDSILRRRLNIERYGALAGPSHAFRTAPSKKLSIHFSPMRLSLT